MRKSLMGWLSRHSKTIIIIILIIFILLILFGFFLGPDRTWQPLDR